MELVFSWISCCVHAKGKNCVTTEYLFLIDSFVITSHFSVSLKIIPLLEKWVKTSTSYSLLHVCFHIMENPLHNRCIKYSSSFQKCKNMGSPPMGWMLRGLGTQLAEFRCIPCLMTCKCVLPCLAKLQYIISATLDPLNNN